MNKIKVLFLGLAFLLISAPAFAVGTWDHRSVKTKPNGNVIVEFIRQITLENINVTFSRVIGDGSEQLAMKKWNLEVGWSMLNGFDLGENSKEILIMLIKAVRNNPGLTVIQMTVHVGLDIVAIATFGVYTKTYGSGDANIYSLYSTFGFLEDFIPVTSRRLRRYIRMVLRV